MLTIVIFSYLRLANVSNTDKINKERASLILVSTMEKIRSSRDSFVNLNSSQNVCDNFDYSKFKYGWCNFVKNIDENDSNKSYVLKEIGDGSIYPKGLFQISEGDGIPYEFDIPPYSQYVTTIKIDSEGSIDNNSVLKKDILVFHIETSWSDNDEFGLSNVSQDIVIANNNIYENMY